MRHFKGRIPVMFRGDSTLLSSQQGWKSLVRRQILRWVYRSVDVALYVGSNNREYYLSNGLRPDQLVFAPHAIDNQRYVNANDDHRVHELRQQMGIAQDEVVILFPGKLEEIKQPDLLIDAFQALGTQTPPRNSHLVFVGSGSLEPMLRAKAGANVHFLGFRNQSEMPTMYRMADLVALPSRSETWGLALNEAMACARPVLASDRVGAAVDLIHPGDNGWIFRQGDTGDLTACLKSAIEQGVAGLTEMGNRSSTIIENWSIPKQVESIAETTMRLAKPS